MTMTTVSGDVFQKSEKVTVPMKTSCVHSHVPNNFPCSPHVFYYLHGAFLFPNVHLHSGHFPLTFNQRAFGTGFLTSGLVRFLCDFGWRSFSGISESGDCEGMYIMYHYICIILHKSNVGQNITSSSRPVLGCPKPAIYSSKFVSILKTSKKY